MTASATTPESDRDLSPPPDDEAGATRVRLRFAKRGDLRFISHHDLMRCLERLLRRADLPVAQSQGFNPRPKVTFALALALGIEARDEVMDLELTGPMAPSAVLERLRAESPTGLEFLRAEAVPAGRAHSARVASALYRLAVPEDRRDEARVAVSELLASESRRYLRHRPERSFEVDLRPFVLSAEVAPEGDLVFRLKVTPEGSARPEEVIDSLGLKDLLGRGAVLIREEIELHP